MANRLSKSETRSIGGRLRATDEFSEFRRFLRAELSAVPVGAGKEGAEITVNGVSATVIRFRVQETAGGNPNRSVEFAMGVNEEGVVNGVIMTREGTSDEGEYRVTTYVLDADERVVGESLIVNPLEGESSINGGSNDDVTIQASLQCNICEAVGDALCSLGCGFGAIAACAAAGFTGPQNAVICAGITTTFCTLLPIAREALGGASCQSDRVIEYICERGGYC
jgi:halocin C8-like bacteriocin domain-containing protein